MSRADPEGQGSSSATGYANRQANPFFEHLLHVGRQDYKVVGPNRNEQRPRRFDYKSFNLAQALPDLCLAARAKEANCKAYTYDIILGEEVIKMNIESVRMKYEEQVMRLPNVRGVGIGEKAGRKAIKVFVTHKVPESSLRPEEIIPKILEGYETDVEEIGVVTAETS